MNVEGARALTWDVAYTNGAANGGGALRARCGHSDDYQQSLPLRLRASRGRMIAVEGSEAPAD